MSDRTYDYWNLEHMLRIKEIEYNIIFSNRGAGKSKHEEEIMKLRKKEKEKE